MVTRKRLMRDDGGLEREGERESCSDNGGSEVKRN